MFGKILRARRDRVRVRASAEPIHACRNVRKTHIGGNVNDPELIASQKGSRFDDRPCGASELGNNGRNVGEVRFLDGRRWTKRRINIAPSRGAEFNGAGYLRASCLIPGATGCNSLNVINRTGNERRARHVDHPQRVP